jgi:hypothetical protein
VPDELGTWMQTAVQILVDRVPCIVVAIAAGEDDDADFHPGSFQFSRRCRSRGTI